MKLDTALKYFEEFLCWLDDCRRNGFDSALVTAIEITDEVDILREFKQIRLRKKKIHFDYECPDETTANPEDIFRTEYFNVILDMIHASDEPRFEGLKTYLTSFRFLYNISSSRNKSDEDLLQRCKELQVLIMLSESSDSNINGQELFGELRICTRTVPPNTDIYNSLKYIIDNNFIEVYPNT
jgi:hypothetical protein